MFLEFPQGYLFAKKSPIRNGPTLRRRSSKSARLLTLLKGPRSALLPGLSPRRPAASVFHGGIGDVRNQRREERFCPPRN